MVRIIVVSIFGALLAACSGSSRVEDLLRANAPSHPPTQYTASKSGLDNRGTPISQIHSASAAAIFRLCGIIFGSRGSGTRNLL